MALMGWPLALALYYTILVVKKAPRHMIDAEIASSNNVGEGAFIPHITMTPSEDAFRMPFKLKRRQFPVRLQRMGHLP